MAMRGRSITVEIVQPDIRRYARRTCRQSSDADDAAQETMWLVASAWRAATSRLFLRLDSAVTRRDCSGSPRRLAFRDVSARRFGERAGFEFEGRRNLRLDLAGAIGSLPSHYRRVIILRDIEELGVAELATTENLCARRSRRAFIARDQWFESICRRKMWRV